MFVQAQANSSAGNPTAVAIYENLEKGLSLSSLFLQRFRKYSCILQGPKEPYGHYVYIVQKITLLTYLPSLKFLVTA